MEECPHCTGPVIGGSVKGPREEILLALLKAGADLKLRDNKGRTPPYVAGQCRTVDQVRILLKAGASENIIDENGWNPFFCAVRNDVAEFTSWRNELQNTVRGQPTGTEID
jgi:ankyrin repeat protein